MPPPPPSASYNLKLDDFSDSSEEESDYYSGRYPNPMVTAAADVDGCAVEEAKTNGGYYKSTSNSSETEVIEAIDVIARTDEDSHDDGDDESATENNNCDNNVDEETSSPVRNKKKKKKKKKQKKKKSNIANSTTPTKTNDNNSSYYCDQNVSEEEAISSSSTQSTPTKTSSSKSISFGTVSVREYARTLATHVVPADGGYPLGLSTTIVTEHSNTMDESGNVISTVRSLSSSTSTSSPSPPSSSSSSPSSRSKHHHHHKYHDYHGWKIDDFESRKQLELQQRYTQLIHDQRRRKFEKQWEKKHHSQLHHKQKGGGSGGRHRSGSFSGSPSGSPSKGGGGGGHNNRRSSSGHYGKMEMSQEEKDELDRILAEPVELPTGLLETRPYDYKKKIPSPNNAQGNRSSSSSGKENNLTEEEELLQNYKGRNPLFGIIKEDDRRKVLLRDDHLMKSMEDAIDSSPRRSPRKRPQQQHQNHQEDDDDSPPHLDPTDSAITQHIQHDLESLRIERSTNLGCSCRKPHVFLPGQSDKSHHKKKGSHRRMNERKVREELRKRGLLHGNSDLSRDTMEKMLQDAIESEPCCWGQDCPCVRSGIGCQADICSCWQEHSVTSALMNEKEDRDDLRKVCLSDVEVIERTCGNEYGMYVVDMKKINEYRQQYVATQTHSC